MNIVKTTSSNDKYGLYDENLHKQILPNEYFSIGEIQYNNLVIIAKETTNDYGAQNINGHSYREGLFNTKTCQFVIPCECYSIWKYDKAVDLACVVKEHDRHSSGFINSSGEIIIPFIYDMPYHNTFDTNKTISLNLNGKFGVVNYLNKIKLPFKYDDAVRFFSDEPLSRICENGLYGYVDRNYNTIISCKYRYAGTYFQIVGHWRSIVTDNNGKNHIINEKGDDIIPSKYTIIGVPIGKEYIAECQYYSLFGGWKKEYVSTIDGHVIGQSENSIDQKTKDILAYGIIFGTVTAAKSGLKMVSSMLGYPLPDMPYESYYTQQVRDRAWRKYKESGSIIDALSAMF